jgi:hypothetical protein
MPRVAILGLLAVAGSLSVPGAGAPVDTRPASFVKVVGTTSCGSPSTVIVPAGGVAAGNTLIARVVLRDGITGAITAGDTRGNIYTSDVDRSGSGVRVAILSAHVQSALAPGDTITVTHPDARAEGIVVTEYSGIVATNRVEMTASATGSGQPSVTAAASGPDQLVYGAVGSANNRSHIEALGWTSVYHQGISCGGAPGNADNIGAYQPSGGAGA